MKNITHLHVHSSKGSFLDSTNTVKSLINRAKELGMKALAITEHGYTTSFIEFYKECKVQDIKPLLGCEVYECDNMDIRDKNSRYYHLILIAKNNIGYKNLLKIVSTGFTKGFYYKPRIDLQYIKENNLGEGIICTTACIGGKIPKRILSKDYINSIYEDLKQYQSIFDNFYLELQPSESKIEDIELSKKQRNVNNGIYELSQAFNIPLVITTDVHYTLKEDRVLHQTFIKMAKRIDSDKYEDVYIDNYLQSYDEVLNGFKCLNSYVIPKEVLIEAIENTNRIADMCNVELDLNNVYLPTIELPKGFNNSDELLKDLVIKGCKEKLSNLTQKDKVIYWNRILKELDVIFKKGFSDYFLIEKSFIELAHSKNIRIGVGRGSACGSLVCYVIGITKVDPIKYNLLFSRFLTLDRTELPDIDTDVQTSRRQELINLIKNKYGEEKVAQICNLTAFKSRAIIKAVAKTLDIEYIIADNISKSIPKGYNITDALNENKELQEFQTRYPKLFDLAMKLENITRGLSIHAGGIVITPKDKEITDFCSIALGKDNEIIIQLDKVEVEEVGLVKFDLLGLSTLDIIEDTVNLIKSETGKDVEQEILKDGFKDERTWSLYKKGILNGVFQCDSEGMQEAIKSISPSNIEELSNAIALYRPATMQGLKDYIDKKQGRKEVTYIHKDLEPILQNTLGELVYQEQTMMIVHQFGDFNDSEQDMMRKAISKKKQDLLNKLLPEFKKRGLKKGYNEETLDKLIEIMSAGAKYSFNKSHSIAYSITSFYTAYLKVHYPVHFMCSILSNQKKTSADESSETLDTDTLNLYLTECKRLGIEITHPSINYSSLDFCPSKNCFNSIIYGFKTIKSLKAKILQQVMENRPFTSFRDFYERISDDKLSFIALIKSGCFDEFNSNREEVLREYIKYRIIDKKEKYNLDCVNNSKYKKLIELNKVNEENMFKFDDKTFKNIDELKEYAKATKKISIKKANELWKVYLNSTATKLWNEYAYSQNLLCWENELKDTPDVWEFNYLSNIITYNPFKEFDYTTQVLDKNNNIKFPCIVEKKEVKLMKYGFKAGQEKLILLLKIKDNMTAKATCTETNLFKFLDKGSKVVVNCYKNSFGVYYINGVMEYDKYIKKYQKNKN